jgi:hypothetical protein
MKIFKQKNQNIIRVTVKDSENISRSIRFIETDIDECMDSVFSIFSNFSNPVKKPKCTVEFRDMFASKTQKYKSFKIFGISSEKAMDSIYEKFSKK